MFVPCARDEMHDNTTSKIKESFFSTGLEKQTGDFPSRINAATKSQDPAIVLETWQLGEVSLPSVGCALSLAKCPCVLFNPSVLNQQTLNRPAGFSGIGLHSGNRVNMTILPAPANSGVRFRRVDLDGKPEIEARVENVVETNRSTTLAKGNVKVHTVERVLAALAGYGVDNAIVELDANEPPIADGSSREFCKIIQSAGIVPQAENREPYTPAAPIELQVGETTMTLFPDEAFKITCTSADKRGRFTQF